MTTRTYTMPNRTPARSPYDTAYLLGVADAKRYATPRGRYRIGSVRFSCYIRGFERFAKPAPAFQDISHISEYGLTQKLSYAIRCF